MAEESANGSSKPARRSSGTLRSPGPPRTPAAIRGRVVAVPADPDRKRLDRRPGGPRHDRHDGARVEPSAEEGPDRDVTHQVGAHRVLDPRPELGRRLVLPLEP